MKLQVDDFELQGDGDPERYRVSLDIPQIETRCLTDVLDLPWGVEIYELLARWNPLPKMFDQITLLEMGFEVDKLDARAEAFLKEKFG